MTNSCKKYFQELFSFSVKLTYRLTPLKTTKERSLVTTTPLTLGSLLSSKRKKAGRKSSDVLREAKIPASLALYSQWEHDRKIPTPETLEKLCEYLSINKKVAFSLWAQSHMPTKNLKKLFLVSHREFQDSENLPQLGEMITYPASVTKTIQERDANFFIENPAAGAILMRGLAAGNLNDGGWPKEKLIDGLGLTLKQGVLLINQLVDMHYLIRTNEGYRTPIGIKYIFMPETEVFEKLRNERIKFNCGRLLSNIALDDLKNNSACRINLTNKLSKDQLKEVINLLKETSVSFMTGEEKDDQSYFQLIALVGPEYEAK